MRILFLIILFVVGEKAFSQTIIKLTHKSGPKHDYHYVNPKDTAYVFVYRDADMGQWTDPAYTLKLNVPDGKYCIYINGVLDMEAFVKNQLPDSTWIKYSPDGSKRTFQSFKNGKLNGYDIHYFNNGDIWAISNFNDGNLIYGISYFESGYTASRQYWQGENLIEEHYSDSATFRTTEFDKTKNTFYILNPKRAGIFNDEIAIKVPYKLDPFTIVIGITNKAKKHPELLKKFLKKNKLKLNNDDFIWVYENKNRYLNSFAIRVTKQNNTAFTNLECKELETIRENRDLVRIAGPRIEFLSDTTINKESRPERYAMFTTSIDVLIDSKDETEFFNLIEKEKLYHVYQLSVNENKVYYRLIYNSDVGAGINEIATRLLANKIIIMTYPIVEQLQPKNSHQARF